MNKKYLTLGIITTLVIAFAGVTYAYWLSGIQGEGANMNVTLDLDGASVIFTDTTEIAETGVKPGWETSKTFTIENTNVVPFTYDIYIKDLVNTLVSEGFLQYKINSSNGYDMGEEYAPIDKSATPIDFDLATRVTIPANTTQEYTISIRYFNSPDVDQSEDKGKSFSGCLMIRENTGKTLYSTLTDGTNYPDVKTRDNFDTVLGDAPGTTGVIYKEDTYKEDGAPVYYFAGNSLDNWVKFAGLYWRIIRTNENGSVRLLYAGTSPDTTEGYIGQSTYNSTSSDTMYVGYMYHFSGNLNSNRGLDNNGNYIGSLINSTIKTEIDTWFQNKLCGTKINEECSSSNYDLIDKDAIYCNDRSGESYSLDTSTYYAANKRLEINKRPTYKCGGNTSGGLYSDANEADKFTHKESTKGNKKLIYPIGLMTADEIVFAGGKWATNAPNTYYYLNSEGNSVTGSNYWWTMSPSDSSGHGSNGHTYVFYVGGTGYIADYSVSITGSIRPVLSLKGDVIVTGTGTSSDPYTIKTD